MARAKIAGALLVSALAGAHALTRGDESWDPFKRRADYKKPEGIGAPSGDDDSPTDWHTATDQKSGRTYFYNLKTGKRQWNSPAQFMASRETSPQDLQISLENIDKFLAAQQEKHFSGDVSDLSTTEIFDSFRSFEDLKAFKEREPDTFKRMNLETTLQSVSLFFDKGITLEAKKAAKAAAEAKRVATDPFFRMKKESEKRSAEMAAKVQKDKQAAIKLVTDVTNQSALVFKGMQDKASKEWSSLTKEASKFMRNHPNETAAGTFWTAAGIAAAAGTKLAADRSQHELGSTPSALFMAKLKKQAARVNQTSARRAAKAEKVAKYQAELQAEKDLAIPSFEGRKDEVDPKLLKTITSINSRLRALLKPR